MHSWCVVLLWSIVLVFQNDDTTGGIEESVPEIDSEEYSGLRAQDLQEAKDQLLVETADMLSIPLFTAEALLRNHGRFMPQYTTVYGRGTAP